MNPSPQQTDETPEALRHAFDHALRYLSQLDRASVGPETDLATLRLRLAKPLSDASLPASQVIDDLVDDCAGGIVGTASGRFFAWVIGGSVPASLGADWLTSAWDQNAGIYAASPAAAVVEEVAGAWLKELLGLPTEASFALVTGCQMAHVTCLAAARYAVLRAKGWNAGEQGLFGAPRIRILAGSDRHGTTDRALRLLGIGTRSVESIELTPDALDAALAREPDLPAIVLLQAGELNTGVFDDFEGLIPIAKRRGAWVHVDGAFGLWAAASPRYKHFVQGVAGADSWATDGHKWLNVPYDSGYAFVRDREAHLASMTLRESYLIYDQEARDQVDWNPEFSRRARGFASYAALRQLGRSGIADLVDRCCEHARAIVDGIGKLRGAEVMARPVLNQGLVRFPDPAGHDDNAHTDRVIARIVASGEAFVGGTNWRGMRCMRVSVVNWRTTASDAERTVRAVEQAIAASR
jgi:aromatic-L-amino-acid decarboxylase